MQRRWAQGPIVTLVLAFALTAAFALELAFAVDAGTGPLSLGSRTLLIAGGMFPPLVHDGDWWRLGTATFVHGDVFQLAAYASALLIAGLALERRIGGAWLAALFFLGGAAGNACALVANADNAVEVGAAGGVMAILGAGVVAALAGEPAASRRKLLYALGCAFVPAAVPLISHASAGHVDFAGHIGGAAMGVAAGALLTPVWRGRVRLRALAIAMCVAGIGVAVYGGLASRHAYLVASLMRDLAPSSLLAGSDAAERSEEAVRAYPRDPRARFIRALALLDRQDLPGAERELRAALAERDILRLLFAQTPLEREIRVGLVSVLVDEKKLDDARAVAEPICNGPAANVPEGWTPLHVCGPK